MSGGILGPTMRRRRVRPGTPRPAPLTRARATGTGGSPGCEPCCQWRIATASSISRETSSFRHRRLRHRRDARLPRRRRRRGRVGRHLTQGEPDVGGQVKTFHHAVYAGILARRDVPAQLEELEAQGIGLIDIVVVNVKPFAPAIGVKLIGLDEAIEMIDVGGAALLGAAARNAAGRRGGRGPGALPDGRRRAARVGRGQRGDARAARRRGVQHRRRVPRRDRRLSQPDLRQHVPAATSRWSSRRSTTCATARTRTSAPRSTARRRIAAARSPTPPAPGRPAVVQQPARPRCGLPHRPRLHDADRAPSSSTPTRSAWPRTTSWSRPTGTRSRPTRSRPSAAIVGVNRELDGATAREIAANSYEAVVAPGFSQSAIGILRGKPGLELLAIPPDPTEGMRDYGIASLDFKRVAGGLLVESLDELGLDRGQLQVVTQRRPTLEELTDLLFAWRAVRHVRSNAIVLARNGATVGIGAGQASRQVSVEIAAPPGRRPGASSRSMASDAYFPFPDGIQAGGRGRRHGDHPAGRLDPRRDGHRGRRPPPPGDGLHRPTALPPLIDRARLADGDSSSRSR